MCSTFQERRNIFLMFCNCGNPKKTREEPRVTGVFLTFSLVGPTFPRNSRVVFLRGSPTFNRHLPDIPSTKKKKVLKLLCGLFFSLETNRGTMFKSLSQKSVTCFVHFFSHASLLTRSLQVCPLIESTTHKPQPHQPNGQLKPQSCINQHG